VSKDMIVYHVGYSDAHADERLMALMNTGDPVVDANRLIIDTRKVPFSWRESWSRYDRCYVRSKALKDWKQGDYVPEGGRVVSGLQSTWTRRYRWAGAVLGNKNYNKPGAPIDIIDMNRGIGGLMMYMNEGYTPILVCECANLYACHRYKILQALKEYMPSLDIRNADGSVTEIYPVGVSLFGK
jgi:hypothetical protein